MVQKRSTDVGTLARFNSGASSHRQSYDEPPSSFGRAMPPASGGAFTYDQPQDALSARQAPAPGNYDQPQDALQATTSRAPQARPRPQPQSQAAALGADYDAPEAAAAPGKATLQR